MYISELWLLEREALPGMGVPRRGKCGPAARELGPTMVTCGPQPSIQAASVLLHVLHVTGQLDGLLAEAGSYAVSRRSRRSRRSVYFETVLKLRSVRDSCMIDRWRARYPKPLLHTTFSHRAETLSKNALLSARWSDPPSQSSSAIQRARRHR